MRILVVNPNTTRSMTEKIGAAALAVAAAGTEIVAVSPSTGPASIEGYYDEAFAVPGVIDEVRKGDKRIIIVDGEPVGAINRVPSEGEARSNMHVGGRPELST